MGKHSFFGGLLKFTVAAAAVSGICYMFKDEIKGSKAYQELKVDDKIQKAKSTIKDTTETIKDKTEQIKEKAAKYMNNEDEIIDDDEIILGSEGGTSERDYLSINPETAEAATEEAASEDVSSDEVNTIEI